jgi:hypothetical protein
MAELPEHRNPNIIAFETLYYGGKYLKVSQKLQEEIDQKNQLARRTASGNRTLPRTSKAKHLVIRITKPKNLISR